MTITLRVHHLIFLMILSILSAAAVNAAAEGNDAATSSNTGQDFKLGDPQLDVEWIDEKNGQYLPLDALFVDEEGNQTTLRDIIDRPTLVLPIYFYCPSSCSLNLANLATSIKRSSFSPGKDFKIIAFSFNEEENEENAKIAKRNYLRLLPKDFPQENWKFLTGKKENILAVTSAMGYKFQPLNDGTFIHPSAMVAVAADGMIIKYIYGKFITGDIDMAIADAKSGTPAMSVRRFLDYCFNYSTEKSSSFFTRIKIAVTGVFILFGVIFVIYVKRSKRK